MAKLIRPAACARLAEAEAAEGAAAGRTRARAERGLAMSGAAPQRAQRFTAPAGPGHVRDLRHRLAKTLADWA